MEVKVFFELVEAIFEVCLVIVPFIDIVLYVSFHFLLELPLLSLKSFFVAIWLIPYLLQLFQTFGGLSCDYLFFKCDVLFDVCIESVAKRVKSSLESGVRMSLFLDFGGVNGINFIHYKKYNPPSITPNSRRGGSIWRSARPLGIVSVSPAISILRCCTTFRCVRDAKICCWNIELFLFSFWGLRNGGSSCFHWISWTRCTLTLPQSCSTWWASIFHIFMWWNLWIFVSLLFGWVFARGRSFPLWWRWVGHQKLPNGCKRRGRILIDRNTVSAAREVSPCLGLLGHEDLTWWVVRRLKVRGSCNWIGNFTKINLEWMLRMRA